MLVSQVQLLVLALFPSVMLGQVSVAPPRDVLRETPRADITEDKDLAHLLLLKLLSDLVAARGDHMLPELEEKEQVMRRHLSLSQRERKAGCRNFFWKTFTSC